MVRSLDLKEYLAQKARATPALPGVYIMRDASGQVLYVGKAASLRHRVASYFTSPAGQPPKVRNMLRRVADFDYIITESEQEALILESNLIKEHQPPYNARLKDDKSYPFIKIDLTEDFPQVYVTRRVDPKDGARYFGPFASASSVRRTLALLKKLFPYRSCTKAITGNDPRACLDYYIHRCVGPCIGAVSRQEYREVIDQVVLFLEGRTSEVVRALNRRMREAAESLEFERAAALRDQIRAIERVHEGQKVLRLSSENMDVIAAARGQREAWVEVFFVRHGKLVGRDNFIMDGAQDEETAAILTAFVKQFYERTPHVPETVLVQEPLEDAATIEAWLRSRRGGRVELRVPRRGEKRRLMEMVVENALQGLQQLQLRQEAATDMEAAMAELQEALSLPRLPRRMECFDISNIQGSSAVGSMAVFQDGRPATAHYRRFQVKTVQGVDDYAMMREVLTRRFKRLAKAMTGQGRDGSTEASWGAVPDLVIIDGGRGHLGVALQVFLELGINEVPLASIAKEREEIFVPQVPEPIVLPRNSPALFLVQRIRDEAHRFAITYHRRSRSRRAVGSLLDTVPGIGPKRRRMLLRRFGSVRGVREASVEELASVPGMTLKLARRLKEYL